MSMRTMLTAAAILSLSSACPGGDGDIAGEGEGEGRVEPCNPVTLDNSACDPATATFSLRSTNVYYPLHIGLETVL